MNKTPSVEEKKLIRCMECSLFATRGIATFGLGLCDKHIGEAIVAYILVRMSKVEKPPRKKRTTNLKVITL